MSFGDNDQMVGAGEGALSGAAAGASFGGVPGAVIGGVAGGVFGALGSNKKGYSLPWDQYNARLGQISNYQNQLSGATSQYATAIGNMYNTAYNQYLPNAAAAFANRGLNVDSGAFGAELARQSASYIAQGNTDVAKMNINNINSVNNQYGNAWEAMFGAANESSKAGFNNANANMAGLAQAAVGVGKLGLALNSTPKNPWSTDYSIPMTGSDGGSSFPNSVMRGGYNGAPFDPMSIIPKFGGE